MQGNLVFVFDFDQTLAITDVEKGRDSQWLDLRGFIRFNEKMMEFLRRVRVHHKVYLFTIRHPDVLDLIYEKLGGLIPRENMYARRFGLDKKCIPDDSKAFMEKLFRDKYERLFQLGMWGGTVIAFDDEYQSILKSADRKDPFVFLLPPIEE